MWELGVKYGWFGVCLWEFEVFFDGLILGYWVGLYIVSKGILKCGLVKDFRVVNIDV